MKDSCKYKAKSEINLKKTYSKRCLGTGLTKLSTNSLLSHCVCYCDLPTTLDQHRFA